MEGRPWQDTRAVLNGSCGSWVPARSGGTAQEISAVPNLPPPLPAVGTEGKLEEILRVLAEQLHARGKLELEEGFIDASFTGQKRGLAVGPTKRGKGTKILAICTDHSLLSPLVSKALRRTKASWSKSPRASFLDELPND